MHNNVTSEALYLLDLINLSSEFRWFLVTVRTSFIEAVRSSFCHIRFVGSVLDYQVFNVNGVLEHDTGERSLRDSSHTYGKQQAWKLLDLKTKK